MKIEVLNSKFTPIELKLKIETDRELEAFLVLAANTTATSRAEYLNENLDGDFNKFEPEEVLFIEEIATALFDFIGKRNKR